MRSSCSAAGPVVASDGVRRQDISRRDGESEGRVDCDVLWSELSRVVRCAFVGCGDAAGGVTSHDNLTRWRLGPGE